MESITMAVTNIGFPYLPRRPDNSGVQQLALAITLLLALILTAANAQATAPGGATGLTAKQAKALAIRAIFGKQETKKLFMNVPRSADNPELVQLAKTFHLQYLVVHYYQHAVHWWSLAAKQDFVPALDRLAFAYYKGKGVQQLYVVAMQLWRAAAKRGDAEGQSDLAECYRHGWGTARNASRAAFWMKKAAAQGFEFALYHLGNWYAGGYGVKKSRHEALTCWKKAAALGGPIANAAEARINAVSAKPANPSAKP